MYTVGDIVNFVPSDWYWSCCNTIHRGVIVDECLVGGICYYTIREYGMERIYSSIRSWQIKKDDRQMKKSDLKNRMIVETRNGNRFIVVDEYLLDVDGTGFMDLSSYTDDLMNKSKSIDSAGEKINREYDIMKVYDQTKNWNYYDEDDLLWERKKSEPVEMKFSMDFDFAISVTDYLNAKKEHGDESAVIKFNLK